MERRHTTISQLPVEIRDMIVRFLRPKASRIPLCFVPHFQHLPSVSKIAQKIETKRPVIRCAAKIGSLSLLEWAIFQLPLPEPSWSGPLREYEARCEWEHVCEQACRRGHLHVVQWLRQRGCPWEKKACCSAAAAGGHQELLAWLFVNGCRSRSARVCAGAARGGHFQLLLWAHREHRCTLDYGRICAQAARGGHLNILRWATTGDYFDPKEQHLADCCDQAASGGHLHVLEWLLQQPGYVIKDPGSMCLCAIQGGHVQVLEWAWGKGFCDRQALGKWSSMEAAKHGRLNVLQWLHHRGCPWTALVPSLAAEAGHLEMLRWARERGCPWDATTCASAARGGHLEILRWARSKGLPLERGRVRCGRQRRTL